MSDAAPAPDRDEPRLRAYLLGGLTDAERAAIEARFFEDEGLYEHLLGVQYDLIDAYARDELTPAERAEVEHRLIQGAEGARRLQLATALGHLQPAGAARDTTRRSRARLLPVAAAAALVLASAAVSTWLAWENARLRRELLAARSTTTPAVSPAPPPAGAPIVADLRLSPRVLRSDLPPTEATLPSNARLVRVLLSIDEAAPSVTVVLERAGSGRLFTQSAVTERLEGAVVVWVPAALLEPGDYEFVVWRGAEGTANLLASYLVRVGR